MYLNFKKWVDNVVCQLSHWKNSAEFNRIRNEKGDYSLEGFDRLQCIYIHIPKAAGISINKALFGNYGGGHKTVQAYKKIFGPKLFHSYYKFTFVRNPYSRLFSAYQFLKKGGFNEKNQSWFSENLSGYTDFDDFVRNWVNEKNIRTYIHFQPQYSFVCNIGTEPEVDFIGKVESIDRDFNEVCKVLKIPNKLSVHNRNENDLANWEHYYTPYSMDKVADIYSMDFQVFDYPKNT